jgi:hypothetical protein
LKQHFRLWFPERGLALSASHFDVVEDKQIRMLNLSVAFFHESKGDGADIVCFRVPEAILKLDRRVDSPAELSNCKILAIEAVAQQVAAGKIGQPPVPPVPPGAIFTPGGLGTPMGGFGGGGTFPALGGGGFPGGGGGGSFRIVDGTSNTVMVGELPMISGFAGSVRFKFKIDPKTPINDLLPKPPLAQAKLPVWTSEDLAKVPDLTFGEPISKMLKKEKAMEAIAHQLAKANHLNQAKTDGFMLALIDRRAELRGMPYLMGDECRTREEQARMFNLVVEAIHQNLPRNRDASPESMDQFWSTISGLSALANQNNPKNGGIRITQANREQFHRAMVAALMQILMPESEQVRYGLAKYLATVPNLDATRALAKLAIFSPEEEVRNAAIEGLKVRRERDYTEVLVQGFNYPLPAVAKRAADALVKLERKDVVENLVQVLEKSDPRLPVTEKRDGKDVTVVREMVKVNHHRNCMLCHAPGNAENVPDGILKVAVPLPTEPLPKPSDGGGYQSVPPPSPDILVRLDMTYLRQDFSVMMPVSDAHPWPEMQRFDFLVRTRTLTQQEAQAYEPCCEVEEPGRLSPYHRAALYALRELTGRDTEPTATAWRRLLKMPK